MEEGTTAGDPQSAPQEASLRAATLEEQVERGRLEIKHIAEFVLRMKQDQRFTNDQVVGEDLDEAEENIMFAYRHLEDARMRLGKILQALNGGESSYKK